jgi:hypothetical protein
LRESVTPCPLCATIPNKSQRSPPPPFYDSVCVYKPLQSAYSKPGTLMKYYGGCIESFRGMNAPAIVY